MRVTLEVRSGPAAGKNLVLEPGQKALVGKASWADLSLPQDSALSGRHFTLECDDIRCLLRDFRGSDGTLLNGGKVAEAVLKDGDQIVAGQSTFGVSIASGAGIALPPALAPAPQAPPEPAPVPEAPAAPGKDLLSILREAQPLFAILDAARDPRVLELLRNSKEQFESLYEGEKGEELAEWAPYLVKLPAQSALLETLVQEGWGDSWGVYLTCNKPFDEVRKHFRHFLLVKLEGGEEVYFRFYDPRVLRVYLPTCDYADTKEFFGTISSFLMEAEEPDKLLRFTADRPTAKREEVAVAVTA